jgi:DNA polymerase-3 subunit epsilon
MREIVFDTETTGLDPGQGHRLVEFAGVELRHRVPTGRVLHFHCCPERAMPAEAEAVHGLTDAFLAAKPRFAEEAGRLLAFLGDAILVAHNAAFDLRFLNAELERCGRGPIDAARVVDTLELARRRLPGAKHSLDALCQRFAISTRHRVVHGALIDAELLADVYVELTGGRQIGFDLAVAALPEATRARPFRPARAFAASEAERLAHAAFLDGMRDPVWRRAPASG